MDIEVIMDIEVFMHTCIRRLQDRWMWCWEEKLQVSFTEFLLQGSFAKETYNFKERCVVHDARVDEEVRMTGATEEGKTRLLQRQTGTMEE